MEASLKGRLFLLLFAHLPTPYGVGEKVAIMQVIVKRRRVEG